MTKYIVHNQTNCNDEAVYTAHSSIKSANAFIATLKQYTGKIVLLQQEIDAEDFYNETFVNATVLKVINQK